eukprot:scaffold80720_cov71-Phaeocystis_antarctica.AAC.2
MVRHQQPQRSNGWRSEEGLLFVRFRLSVLQQGVQGLAPKEGPPMERNGGRRNGGGRSRAGGLQQRVRDRAAVPEGRHATRSIAARQRRQARRQRARHATQRRAHVRDEQTRQACSRLSVAAVGLDAARRQPNRWPQRPRPRAHLDRVAQRRARAMGLKAHQLSRVDTALSQCCAQQRLLGLTVGRGEAGAATVAHHAAAEHAGRGAVVVLSQHDHSRAAALAPGKAVGAAVEGVAAAARRCHPRGSEAEAERRQ